MTSPHPAPPPFCEPQLLEPGKQNLRRLRDHITGVATCTAAGAALAGEITRVLLHLPSPIPQLSIFSSTTLVLDAYTDAGAAQQAYDQHIGPVLAEVSLKPRPLLVGQAPSQPQLVGLRTNLMDDLGGHQPFSAVLIFELGNSDSRTTTEAYAEVCTQIDQQTGGQMPDGAFVHLAFDITAGGRPRLAIVEIWRDIEDFTRFGQALGMVLAGQRIPQPHLIDTTTTVDYTIGLNRFTWPATTPGSIG